VILNVQEGEKDMDFEMSNELKDFQQTVRQYVEQRVLSQIREYEDKSIFPIEIWREMGSKGFLKAHVAKEYGGLGLGTMAFCLLCEEVSRAGAGMTNPPVFQTGKMILHYGTPKQKEKYLKRLLSGEYVAATAISEPTVGSSFADMRTKMEKRGDVFIINGVKTLINDAAEADIINVFAKDESGNVSVFLVEKGNPGMKILKKLDPIGMRSSPVYEFELKDCAVKPEQLIGEVGGGLKTFFAAFNFSRLGNASAALGVAQAALDKAVGYVKGRKVGKYIASEFQGLRWVLAEASTKLEAARLMRNRAAVMEENKQDVSIETSRTKLMCVNVANEVVGECIQATGRYGCLRDSLMEMYLRDARLLGTAGGSLEVMKNNIARSLLGG
jgi:alkylation response protein AidB-like acyl-CoA dehydrogenase